MEYRNLGRTGVKVSQLCLGTMMFGRSANEQDSIAIVHAALERGVNFVDTANAYSAGASEQFVGRALANGRRASVVLATKAFFPQDQKDPNARGLSRRHLIEACEASLKRLQTDWIDLYQVHRSQSDIPIDETLRALDDLIRAGKVRYIGTSMFPAWKSVESLWASKELGLNRFVCEQMAYNLLDRTAEREVIPAAQTFGFALIPWAPLCGGLLTGKYKRPAAGTAARTISAGPRRPRRSTSSKVSSRSRRRKAARRRSSRLRGTRRSPASRRRSSGRARSSSCSTTWARST
jgi:aryl-alcohol dehydrogenase-like predicted oxidoreductase